MVSLVISIFGLWVAKQCFEAENYGWGWINLVFSSANLALFLTEVFP